jgi:hypothetical protein
VKLTWIDNMDKSIYFSKDFLTKNNLYFSKVILHFGYLRLELPVVNDPILPEDTIGLPLELFNRFTIPDSLTYELRIDGRNIYLGPVICFVPVARKDRLTSESIDIYKKYMINHSQINGLVYICAAESIDIENEVVEGFFYNPKNSQFIKGTFPLPSAIYRKTDFRKSLYEGLIKKLGDKIFNSHFFNKWELWETLSPIPGINEYLPHTEKLKSSEQLKRMIELHGTVYLKQIDGSQGKGLIRVHQSEQGYHVMYRLDGERLLADSKELDLFVQKLIQTREYIIQQALSYKAYDDRNFDFRVILQRDGSTDWVCSGMIGRFGKRNNIATNFTSEGFAMTGAESLKLAFGLSDKDAFSKEQEIIRVCKQVCDRLQSTIGHYADLGLDIIVDEHLKVWVLEVNKLHDHNMPKYGLKDHQMYYKVITNPFLYAKSLAGF